jgi:hypothetical protein
MNDPYERERFRLRAEMGRRAIEKFRARSEALARLPWNEIQTVGVPPTFSEKPPEGWNWDEYYKRKLGIA